MFDLRNLFKKKNIEEIRLDRDAVAELLSTTPEALAAFEESYMEYTGAEMPGDFFQVNSRQAAAEKKAFPEVIIEDNYSFQGMADSLISRIVDELLHFPTRRYVYDGKAGRYEAFVAPHEEELMKKPVSNEEIKALPEKLRPQLAGALVNYSALKYRAS